MVPRQLLQCGGPPQDGFVVAKLTPLSRPRLLRETFGLMDSLGPPQLLAV
jgi:hypothetical protein